MGRFIPTWQGEAVNWECDELGHLNMRHYMTKAQQARQMFVMQMGLAHAFRRGSPSTVRVREFHIKYLREARPGARLRIETGMTRQGETDMSLLHMMYHANGEIAATIHEQVEHYYLRTHAAFTWPKRAADAYDLYNVDQPEIAKPRGLSLSTPMTGATMDEVKAWGLPCIGLGVFTTQETGPSHTVSAQHLIGRISECVGNFRAGWPEADGWESGNAEDMDIMGVMLESRYRIYSFPEAGQPFHIYSGVLDVTDKIRRLVHHFIDPLSGQPIASVIAVNGLINLKTRKFATPTTDNLEKVRSAVTPGLHA